MELRSYSSSNFADKYSAYHNNKTDKKVNFETLKKVIACRIHNVSNHLNVKPVKPELKI